MRLLLINPKYPESFWSFRWALREILPHKRAINPPLGLATLAALCPGHWEVEIVDENIQPMPLGPRADLVGICGMGVQFGRQRELLGYYRSRGYFVVAGGSYASLCPERYETLADTVIAGEAEDIWRHFCEDYERGSPRPLYRETGTVAMKRSPTPRFDLLRLDQYTTATIQFSRGCPYRCEFCDIIVMFGRKPRCKSVEQVGRELDALRASNIRNVFFVDDNLIGNRPVAKDLLRFLADYQARHRYAFGFGTEVSLNLAQYTELLQMFREANFTWVFIGIETPDEDSLREAGKLQNTREDILTSVHRIFSHGVDVLAGFIVGFDNDTLASFEKQYRFIMDSGIQAAMIGLLTALPRTPLYERLEREGRLIPEANDTDNTKLATNIIPKNMSYEAMIEAYQTLYRRLLSDRSIADRIRIKMRHLSSPNYRGEYTAREQIGIVAKLILKGILPGGFGRLGHFLRTIPIFTPAKIPMVIVDWIAGLAMRDYVDRHFTEKADRSGKAARMVSAFRGSIDKYIHAGSASLSWRQALSAAPDLSLRFLLPPDRRLVARASRHLRRFMKHTRATITLYVEELQGDDFRQLNRLLSRLAKFGDRISIIANAEHGQLLPIDSSIFHLVLQSRWK